MMSMDYTEVVDMANTTDEVTGGEIGQEQQKYRGLSQRVRMVPILLSCLGTLVAVVYIFNIGVGIWGPHVLGTAYLHLSIALFLPSGFLYFPLRKGIRSKTQWFDAALALLSFIAPFYFFLHGERILVQGWEVKPPALAVLFGVILWGLSLEISRRAGGWVLFFLVLIFSVFPLFGSHLPGFLQTKTYPLSRLVGYNIMGPDGIIGIPIRVVGTLLIGFMIFGVTLTNMGGGKFFLTLALSILGNVRGATAKTAVISSALLGSITGSVITNVITTGSFTIPAMKRAGFSKDYAGAVEACASAGGCLMPPVMGAAAFIMAGILNITYAEVAIAAAVPSILYYLGIFVQVDGYAAKHQFKREEQESAPSLFQALKQGWHFIISFAVLIYSMFFLHQEAEAPFYASLIVLLCGSFKKGSGSALTLRSLGDLFEGVAKVMAEITGLLAAIGILAGAIFLTGIGQTLSSDLIRLAGNNHLLLLFLAAVASFILGMGLTVTACYLLLAVLMAPAITQMGFNPLAAHIFILYCGVLSYITPPVATAAFAAAAISGGSPWKTGWQAVALGAVKYFIPFFVVLHPALILHGPLLEIIATIITATAGVFFLASGLEGYLIGIGSLRRLNRITVAIGGLLLFKPGLVTDLVGLVLITIVIFNHFWQRNKSRRNLNSIPRECANS